MEVEFPPPYLLYKHISDHLPIFVINDGRIGKIKVTESVQTRNLCNKNILSFQEKLENFDWSFISAIQNVDSAYGSFLLNAVRLKQSKRKLSSVNNG